MICKSTTTLKFPMAILFVDNTKLLMNNKSPLHMLYVNFVLSQFFPIGALATKL